MRSAGYRSSVVTTAAYSVSRTLSRRGGRRRRTGSVSLPWWLFLVARSMGRAVTRYDRALAIERER
jgi:hypothetical protein